MILFHFSKILNIRYVIIFNIYYYSIRFSSTIVGFLKKYYLMNLFFFTFKIYLFFTYNRNIIHNYIFTLKIHNSYI